MSEYISYLERSHAGKIAFSDIIGDSPAMRHALHLAREAAMASSPVWISGEAGTGKELLAKAIHGQCRRAAQPAVIVECSELAMAEAEKLLFGSEAEAITGKLAEAGEGSIILKHVDQLPQAVQRRLLALIERTAEGRGSAGDDHYHARIIMTQTESHKPYLLSLDSLLPDMREACGTVIDVPPLRERADDVRLLTQHYLGMYCASEHKKIRAVSSEGLHYLERGLWHGNVRELMHVIWRAVLLCNHELIEQGDLCLIQQMQPTHYAQRKGAPSACSNPILLDMQGRMRSLESIECEVIQFALMYAGGCMTHAARNLGIGRSTLYRRVHALKLDNYISRENQMTRPMMRMSSKEHS
jgi:DNA-binding NtrC family response regulator